MIVYILFSEKLSRFYIGFTSDLEVRLQFHEIAEQHKFTYNADDWVLYHTITCESKRQALKIEKHIKDMKSKIYIQNLKIYPEITRKLLEKYRDC